MADDALSSAGAGTGADNDANVQSSMQTAPIEQPAVQPAATPTSIRFRTPEAQDTGSANMENLARSLSTFDTGIQSYLDQKQQQQDDRDKTLAEADFHKNNAEGYAQAVQDGKIPAYASQAYVQSYKQAQGSVAGDDLQEKFNAAYDSWGGKNSDDPNAYRDFVTGFLSQNINTNDPDVQAGLMPKINQLVEEGQSRYIQDRHTATVDGSVNAHIANSDNGITNAKNQAVAAGQQINLDSAWNVIQADRSKYLASGGTSAQIDNKYIDLITSQSVQTGGMDGHRILTLMDRPVPGTNYTWAQTPYGQEKMKETNDTLDTLDRRRVSEAKDNQDALNKQHLGDVTTRVLSSIADSPGETIPESLIKEGTQYDPEFRVNAAKWQSTMLKNVGTSDPDKVLNLNWSIVNGGGMQAISTAMQNGDIKNKADLSSALKLYASTDKAKDGAQPIFQSQQFKDLDDAIKARTFNPKDPLAKLAPGLGISDAGLGLRYALMQQVYDWSGAHPGASFSDQQLALGKIGEGLLKGIQAQPLEQPTVTAPATAVPNPYLAPGAPQQSAPPTTSPAIPSSTPPALAPASGSPQAPPSVPLSVPAPSAPTGASPQPPASTPQSPATPPPIDQGKLQGWYQALPVDQKNALMADAMAAQKAGQDPKAVIEARYQQAQATSPLASAAPATASNLAGDFGNALHAWRETDPNSPQVINQLQSSFMSALHNTGQASSSYTLAAIKNNPKVAHILDFISGPESNGNYNAFYQHGNSTYDLSSMTLKQVMDWQEKRTQDGAASSATGRYQFMHTTLGTLKTQLGLTGNEKFTPVFQDELAMQLLKDRGYDRWTAGKMDDATFANNLAYEWASLPNVHTGRSQYAGDGLNKSLVTPRDVLGTLDSAKRLEGLEAPQEADDSDN